MGAAEINEFAEALCLFVQRQLQGQDGEYVRGAVVILDARNHLFRIVEHRATDEADDVYALADLCCVDDEMQTVPDMNRALSVARNYFL
ncbi:MAG: hypothetical protein K5945_09340 [Bacteroidaceae bacterium]|nr:hypothetical protein [Bacteroidaceae bacterium]